MVQKCGRSGTNQIIAQRELSILFEVNTEGEKFTNLSPLTENQFVSFEYKTPRIRLTPADLEGTKLAKPKMLHFVCSPSRALSIISEFTATWEPITIYEPIPVR